MLKGLSPLLTADLVHDLAARGHQDTIAILDRNFAAAANLNDVVYLPGTDLPSATQAVLSLMPLDQFTETPVTAMAVIDDPSGVPYVQRDAMRVADGVEGSAIGVARLQAADFYIPVCQANLRILVRPAHTAADLRQGAGPLSGLSARGSLSPDWDF